MKPTNYTPDDQEQSNLLKSSILSIPTSSASQVLKSLKLNGIDCKYMGVDQSGKLLMEISCTDNQNSLIDELTAYMEKVERIVNKFTQQLEEEIEKQKQANLEKLAELRDHSQEQKPEPTSQA